MDKLNKYRNILREFISTYASRSIYNMPKVQIQFLVSEDKNHFIVYDIGWHEDRFIHDWVFHFELKKGQVWVHTNTTDVDLEREWVNKGIAREDIFGSFLQDEEEWETEVLGEAA